jgi:hypothetical protein
MRRTVPILLAAAASLLAPVAAQGAAKRHKPAPPTCPPRHAEVVVRDSEAVVFRREARFPGFFEEAACSHANTRPFVMIECEELLSCEGPVFDHLTLAGNMLAYYHYDYTGSGKYETEEPTSFLVQVRDLRTHRLIHSAPASTSEPPPSTVIGSGPALKIVAKADGSVAWIARYGLKSGSPNGYEVWEMDKTGARRLDVGLQIRPNSLALAGSTVSWRDGKAASSAPLE